MTPLAILVVALVIVIGGVLVFRLHPFVVLIVAAFVVAGLTPVEQSAATVGQRVAEGFGKTAVSVGIVIAMASILGSCLTAAGGAQRLVTAMQRAVGERRTPLALLLAGFVLGVPMYADTVFYLLVPLARAVWDRTGRGYLLGVLAIVGGATMTHSLVPPTPGPLFVADALGVDIATMIMVGLIVGGSATNPAACGTDQRGIGRTFGSGCGSCKPAAGRTTGRGKKHGPLAGRPQRGTVAGEDWRGDGRSPQHHCRGGHRCRQHHPGDCRRGGSRGSPAAVRTG
jgi:hypothetical protein